MDEGATTVLSPALSHIIERPRLIKLLEDSGARVILLVAPAGYGKTTLARQWAARQSGPVAWYRTTRASGDVAAFAVGLDDVLAATVPQEGRDPKRVAAIASVNARPAPLGRAIVSTYRSLTDEVLLVVDEYEIAGTEEADELLGILVAELAIRFLVTSRTYPPWFSSRRTIYGEAAEVGVDDLTMTDEEALDVLSHDRPPENPAPLLATARGWPAVIGLAAMRTAKHLPPALPPATLYDFLASELLDRTTEGVQDGLTLLAVGAVGDYPTAKLLLGSDVDCILEQARRLGLVHFDENARLSLHPLLRDLLLERVPGPTDDAAAALISRLHVLIGAEKWDEALSASEILPDRRFVSDALGLALGELVRSGRLATLRRWIAAGRAAAADEGLVAYADGEVALRDADLNRAIALGEQAALLLTGDLAAKAHLLAARASNLADRSARARKHFEAAERLAESQDTRAAVLWGKFTQAVDDERTDVAELLDEFERSSGECVDHLIRSAHGRICLGLLDGQLTERLGDAEIAVSLLGQDADPMACSSFLNNYSSGLSVSGHYEQALAAAERELAVADEFEMEFVRRHALVNKARASIGLRRIAVAQRALMELNRRLRTKEDLFLEANAAIERCRLYITMGDLARAYASLFLDLDVRLNAGVKGEYFAFRALSLAGLKRASEALESARRAASVSRHVEVRSVVTVARCVAGLDGSGAAMPIEKAFDEAWSLGGLDAIVLGCRASERFALALASDPRRRETLSGVLARSADAPIARRVGLTIPRPARRSVALSPRELEIQELIAQGLTNHEIARLLYISESTTKVHVRHILEKLGVRSRVEAARVWQGPEAPD